MRSRRSSSSGTNWVGPSKPSAITVTDRPSVVVVPVDYDENMKLTKRLGELLCH